MDCSSCTSATIDSLPCANASSCLVYDVSFFLRNKYKRKKTESTEMDA